MFAGSVPAIPDGTLNLWDADVVEFLESVRVQQGCWPYVLKCLLPDQAEEEEDILALILKSGREWRVGAVIRTATVTAAAVAAASMPMITAVVPCPVAAVVATAWWATASRTR